MKNLKFIFSLSIIFLGSNILLAQLPVYVPADSLLGWWPFSGNADDISINANHGSTSGAQLVTDRFGIESSAYSFGKPADYILVSSLGQESLEGNFTIAVWVNFRNFNIDYPHIISGMNNFLSLYGQGPVYYPDNEKAGFYTTSASSVNQGLLVSQSPLAVNAWHQIVINKKDSEVKMYIDNQLSSANSYENWPLAEGEGIYFGNFYALNNSLDGMIDDIGIWKRSLTGEEMNDLFYMPNTGSSGGSAREMPVLRYDPCRKTLAISGITTVPGSRLRVFLYNMAGQLVLQDNLDSGNPLIRMNMRVTQGVYSVIITDEPGNSWQQKVLVVF